MVGLGEDLLIELKLAEAAVPDVRECVLGGSEVKWRSLGGLLIDAEA
jgi:hypothetical protein